MIDSEDATETIMRGKNVNESVNMRKFKIADCDLNEMNIIIWNSQNLMKKNN